MAFSLTGNLLTGSINRPDIKTFFHSQGTESRYDLSLISKPCRMNKLGYIPIVSTISGLSRILLGIIHTIGHLACAVFSSQRTHHSQEAKLGAKNIARGVIEVVPLVGNLTIYIIDSTREKIFESSIKSTFRTNNADYMNQIALFSNGVLTAKCHQKLAEDKFSNNTNPPTLAEIEKFIRDNNGKQIEESDLG